MIDCLRNKPSKHCNTTKNTTKHDFNRPKKPYDARLYSILLYTTPILVSASCAPTTQTLADCNPTNHRTSEQLQSEH